MSTTFKVTRWTEASANKDRSAKQIIARRWALGDVVALIAADIAVHPGSRYVLSVDGKTILTGEACATRSQF